MKYLLKNSTSKTIWRKVLTEDGPVNTAVSETTTSDQTGGVPVPTQISAAVTNNTFNSTTLTNSFPTHLNKVKLATWSRGFDFSPFFSKKKK